MPQHSLFPSINPHLVGLRVTLLDRTLEHMTDEVQIATEVRPLDHEWMSLTSTPFTGHARDFVATTVEDVVHAWLYEDTRAIVREVQRNDRLARRHHRKHDRIGE